MCFPKHSSSVSGKKNVTKSRKDVRENSLRTTAVKRIFTTLRKRVMVDLDRYECYFPLFHKG